MEPRGLILYLWLLFAVDTKYYTEKKNGNIIYHTTFYHMVCEVKEQQRKKKTLKNVTSTELQNISQCAEQLLCLSLRNAVALAVIH